MSVLIINSVEQACGVYQFGVNIFNLLNSVKSTYKWHIAYCGSSDDVMNAVALINPKAIIFNFHPATLPFVSPELIQRTGACCIAIYHEITQGVADTLMPGIFRHWICSDPSLITSNPCISKFSRPIYQWDNPCPTPVVPTFGTFGFGFKNKGFHKVVQVVQEQYDTAIIKMHIGYSKFFDPAGNEARQRVVEARSLIKKPGIQLVASHDLMTQHELLLSLGQNTANIFLYDNMDRGISSTIDYSMAVKRPIIINKTYMFRHIWGAKPSILIEERTIPQIVADGFEPLRPFYDAWTPQNMANDLTAIVARFSQ